MATTLRIGVLGSGLMGGKLGTLFARTGHDVVFSYARSEQKLKKLAREAPGNASLVYCGDDNGAKGVAGTLVRDVGFDPVDVGPLRVARYLEPFSLLMGQLAYEGDGGPEVAYHFERFAP